MEIILEFSTAHFVGGLSVGLFTWLLVFFASKTVTALARIFS